MDGTNFKRKKFFFLCVEISEKNSIYKLSNSLQNK